jgi:peptide deformylase
MDKKIVRDKKQLKKPCKPCKHVHEGEQIAKELLSILDSSANGIGLAANQIGHNKRVCVIKVNKPIVFINPVITSRFGKTLFNEGCLSFPGDYIITERYTHISVKADNHPRTIFFSAEKDLLECVCIQHEIDHLDGITMYDRMAKQGEHHA